MIRNDKISVLYKYKCRNLISPCCSQQTTVSSWQVGKFFRLCSSNSTKLSYVSCYNSARRVYLADSNYLIDDQRSDSFSSTDRKVSLSQELTILTQGKTEWKYKKRKSLGNRKAESYEILQLYPNCVPVILEKAPNGRIPTAQKEKYLIPRSLSVADFLLMLRKNVLLHEDFSLYLIAENEKVLSPSWTMGDVFDKEKDEDGFLYLIYNSFYNVTCNRSSGRNL